MNKERLRRVGLRVDTHQYTVRPHQYMSFHREKERTSLLRLMALLVLAILLSSLILYAS